ncbi:MAG: hypothetical protein DYH08_17745, partial [Actinobacteria bacterium ATB1]|nr:hypothetical protein [Actinobacteria bacterium ATB1]
HWFSGQEVETPQGRHFETERIWERHRRHGSIGISDLNDLPPDLFDELTGCAVDPVAPHHWAFLDTETTGLAGGSVYDALVGAVSVEHGLPLVSRDARAANVYRALGVEFDLIQ